MSQQNIKYPVAYDFLRKRITSIGEVTESNRRHLGCPNCQEVLIAVLNHQTPHFKHKPHSTCSGNSETFLHWMAKELFKEIDVIELPELFIDDLPEQPRQVYQYNLNKIVDNNVPGSYRHTFKQGLKKNLSQSTSVVIDNCWTEKDYQSDLGNIRVDIVISVGGKEIFIEPYFSNPIDKEKKNKLMLINKPTLSLDLLSFLEANGNTYTVESLKSYLVSKECKQWVYQSTKAYNKHLDNYANYLLEEIKHHQAQIHSHSQKTNEIMALEKEYQMKLIAERNLKEEISDLRDKIQDLRKEIGVFY